MRSDYDIRRKILYNSEIAKDFILRISASMKYFPFLWVFERQIKKRGIFDIDPCFNLSCDYSDYVL